MDNKKKEINLGQKAQTEINKKISFLIDNIKDYIRIFENWETQVKTSEKIKEIKIIFNEFKEVRNKFKEIEISEKNGKETLMLNGEEITEDFKVQRYYKEIKKEKSNEILCDVYAYARQ